MTTLPRLLLDALGQFSTYIYDAVDELLNREYPDGSRATFTYDANGNRTRTENNVAIITVIYDPLNVRDDTQTIYK